MFKKISILFLFLFVGLKSFSQDVSCKVQIITQQLASTDKSIFIEMEKSIFEFVNNTKWTTDIFQINERIECNLILNIKEQVGIDEFKATAQIQSSRPIFNSSYNSTLFNYMDEDWTFKYIINQPLEFNENETRSNLTSLIAYYVYVMVGLDYDSYSLFGGTTYYQKARNIVNNAQTQSGKGWKAFDGTRNRFILVDNFLDNSFKPLRQTIYTYHRGGMDVMTQNAENGRAEIKDLLPILLKLAKDRPNSMALNIFFSAKNDEFVNIFSKALPNEKQNIIQILSEIDPGNSSKYQSISKNN
ncbi:MAG: DUF4835 family protein [Sphingobacteriales bacterium]|nr:DUF4835 family protein [Sphingobacteriales bacterium]